MYDYLKMKAWDKVNKRMEDIDGCNLYLADGKIYECYEGSFAYSGYMEKKDVSYRYIPLRYIGRKDKNKQEIYEDDIVKITYGKWHEEPKGLTRIGVVKYSEKSCAFVAQILNSKVEVGLYDSKKNDIEVLGNIYKNPINSDKISV
jgi:uncharacterized phage protein (TIGR01671 family)